MENATKHDLALVNEEIEKQISIVETYTTIKMEQIEDEINYLRKMVFFIGTGLGLVVVALVIGVVFVP